MINILQLPALITSIFSGFGLYSLFFVVYSFFRKTPFMELLDETANKLISFTGILYFFYMVLYIMLLPVNMDRIIGKYWYGFWLQPITWLFISQLLRFKKVRELKLVRVLFALLFLITFERFVILVTSLHRDFIPTNWTTYFTYLGFLFIPVKVLIFLVATGVFYFFTNGFRKFRTKRED